MNCRPGDLAVIVFSGEFPENVGGLVTVICKADPADFYESPVPAVGFEWECEAVTHLRGWDDAFQSSLTLPGARMSFLDSDLRPIRDQPGEDETLSWAGLPHKQGEPA